MTLSTDNVRDPGSPDLHEYFAANHYGPERPNFPLQ